jgi:hypothetical protein
MERAKWTDDLIDERMAAMDEKFDRLFTEVREFRQEMRAGFSELRSENVGLRRDIAVVDSGLRRDIAGVDSGLRGEIATMRADLWAFQKQVLSIVAGLAIALIGLLGAFVAAQF